MRLKFLTAIAVLVLMSACASADVVNELLSYSFRVDVPNSSGSGVAVVNGQDVFIWTDGHVITHCEKIETVIDPKTSQKKLRVAYQDPKIIWESNQNNRKTGEGFYYAEVIRYSPKDQQDLALLRVRQKGWLKEGARFANSAPKVGAPIWIVGSSGGAAGHNHVSDGVISGVGRLRRDARPNEQDEPVIFDTFTAGCVGGSSGGGIFDKQSGRCYGLVIGGLGGSREILGTMTPSRRIYEFATKYNCKWAIDPTIPVPQTDDNPVRCAPLPLPDDWKPAKSTPPSQAKPPAAPTLIPFPFLPGIINP